MTHRLWRDMNFPKSTIDQMRMLEFSLFPFSSSFKTVELQVVQSGIVQMSIRFDPTINSVV